ncbi:MAG: TadE family type IV pilus minor pilin [Propionibacteriaceae bacterium]|nr:TadE family type IV pilus minor pilin [Propionibacteriaceae bacterium]
MTRQRGAARPAAPRLSAHGQRGMVTVELAVGMMTTTLLAATLAAVVLLGVVQSSCGRTSSEMARQLARGDAVAATKAENAAPVGAQTTVVRQSDGVGVRVDVPVRILGIGGITLTAQNWAAWEPGVGDAAER